MLTPRQPRSSRANGPKDTATSTLTIHYKPRKLPELRLIPQGHTRANDDSMIPHLFIRLITSKSTNTALLSCFAPVEACVHGTVARFLYPNTTSRLLLASCSFEARMSNGFYGAAFSFSRLASVTTYLLLPKHENCGVMDG